MSPELTTADPAAANAPGPNIAPHDKPASMSQETDVAVAMYSEEQLRDFRVRWDQIQAAFVDEPRGAVERADGLVADAISTLADGFAKTRGALEEQWKRGDQVSTEDLRQALMHYRSFFTRLLNT
jgi:hypothetical protein